MPKLVLAQYNVENLFIHLPEKFDNTVLTSRNERAWQQFSAGTANNKSIEKIMGLTAAINDIGPDILMLNEVGGIESLSHFNHYFLKDFYECYLTPGNSDRGIDNGYLISKSFLKQNNITKALLLTHKNRPLALPPEHNPYNEPLYFSRDLAELRLFTKNQNSPQLICLLVHLKSKLDPQSIDPLGFYRRKAETMTLTQVYNQIRQETAELVPIVLSGDFNGNALPPLADKEYSDIYSMTDLIEVSSLLGLTLEDSYTQFQFPDWGTSKKIKLDYFFISPNLKDKIISEGTYIYRHKSETGVVLSPPSSQQQKVNLPSDHYPIVLTLDYSF